MERYTPDKVRLLNAAKNQTTVSFADKNANSYPQHRTDYENGVVLRIYDRQIVQVPEMGISYIHLLS